MKPKVIHILPHSPGPKSNIPNPDINSSTNPEDYEHFVKTNKFPFWAGFFQNDWHVRVGLETLKTY